MMNTPIVYVVISPARDEQAYIETTIASVISQTSQPTEWIIVDDGSRDSTYEIANRYAERYPWIRVLHLGNRGYRSPGIGVIEAFYEGYQSISISNWEYLVKLDADLELSPHYFESCFQQFQLNPMLGIAGGKITSKRHNNDTSIIEETPQFHVRGATKIYRRECWDKIDGLIISTGWDTWDEVKANYYGWRTSTLADVQLKQLRETGEVEGRWRDCVKNGKANYICGYHPLFMLAKCLRRLLRRDTISGLALFYGYVKSAFHRINQVNEKKIISYLRREQIRRLLGRPSIWT
jgi:poly-beta-1,6-N-acetyl-D-glucosamine synthase